MVFTVHSVYCVTTAGLGPLQLVLVGTVVELSILLCEIPTGVVADVYSRRASVILGVFVMGAGFVIEGAWPYFSTILLSQVVWGIGYTCTSGALEAWIADEIGEEQAGVAFLRQAQAVQAGAWLGIGAGTLLGALRLNLPMLVSGALLGVWGLVLLWVMPEEGYRPTPPADRSTWGALFHTLRSGVAVIRSRPSLASVLWIGLFYGMHTEGFDRLWAAYLLERFTFPLFQPVVWFGLIAAAARLLSAGAAGAATRLVDVHRLRSLARALFLLAGVLWAALAGFALSGNLWLSAGLYVLIDVIRNVNSPLYTAWVNHRLDSQVRATVLSTSSQADALGQIAGGPLLGLVANRVSMLAGLLGSALMFAPVPFLLARQLRSLPPEPAGALD
jgi:DHA3 family tetracycline resistance protein-like MFS transporter